MPLALFGIEDGSPQPCRQPADPRAGGRLAVARLLDLRRRPPPDRRPGARHHRDGGCRWSFPSSAPSIYSILRPPEFLADAREREVETQASELRMRHLIAQSCPRCEHPIERSWLRCPECQHRLKDPCRSCNRPVDPRWSVCPYCETPLRRQEKSLASPHADGAASRRARRLREARASSRGRARVGRARGRAPERKQRPSAQRVEAAPAKPSSAELANAARRRRRATAQPRARARRSTTSS